MDVNALWSKIRHGDIEYVKRFIRSHPDSVSQPDNLCGRTPLMLAILNRKTNIVKLLLDGGADVNRREEFTGSTALHYAVIWNPEAVAILLQHPTIQVNPQNNGGQTPLHWACSKGYKDIVGSLLSHIGIKPNVVDPNGDTPLHLAVQCQNYDVVTLMLSQESVNFEMKNNENRTPLLEAVIKRNLGMMHRLIARSANVNAVDNEGNNCLHLVLGRDSLFHSEVEHITILDEYAFKLSLSQKDRTCNTVVASYLFHFGANFYHPNGKDVTPLDLIRDKKLKEKLKTFLPPPCTYCQVTYASSEFKPCGHTVLCRECYMKIKCKTCPTCQQPIRDLSGFETPKFEHKGIQTDATSKELEVASQEIETPKFEHKGIQTEFASQEIGFQTLDERFLLKVARLLGSNWWQVGIFLGIKSTQLGIIRHDFSGNVQEQSFQMLLYWSTHCDPQEVTMDTLRAALEEAECLVALECLTLNVK